MPRYVDIEPFEKEGWHLERTITNQFGVEVQTWLLSHIPTADVIESCEEPHWLTWENGELWGTMPCPMLGGILVDLYSPKGYPVFDSFTAPFVDEDGLVGYYKYDHDAGGWDDTFHYIEEEWDGREEYRL